jgi:hypothetical protein
MTSPEDDDLEETLRRALSAAASEVEPGADGLDKIRARIGGRPPRPWLFSVLGGVVDRVRHWTWRGHWAWQGSLPRPGALRGRRSRRSNFPRWDIRWLRLVTVVAGAAVIASITLGVQPFRHAILQASTALEDGNEPPQHSTGTGSSAGTEGNGARAGGGGTPTADGATSGGGQAGQGGATTDSRNSETSAPHPASTASCAPSALPVVPGAKPSPTDAVPDGSGTAPAAAVPSPLTSSPATSVQPYDTNTDVRTCPVAPPASSPTPTPTSSPASPIPTPSDVSPADASPTPAPTDTAPRQWPTPTASPSADPASPSPTAPPSRSAQGPDRRHGELRDPHPSRS